LSDKISDKDKKVWEKFLSSNDKLPDKDIKTQSKERFLTRSIDLHGHTLENANKAVENFITQAFEDKIGKIIVVTGKGLHSKNDKDPYVSKDLSILKYSVPEFINNNQILMSMINDIKDAKIEDGGSGAFYIFLKKKYDK
jgi:DNA-nicking Smr family endonuclease|tara:strand:- start:110 stop:529 length:420 start_codon:yes stop_codon:yes gene_type:complete